MLSFAVGLYHIAQLRNRNVGTCESRPWSLQISINESSPTAG